jgi:hypothetical protein
MNCRDVREVADSFLCEELLTETNHEILRHLDTCPSCRAEIDARRRFRAALRTAFEHAPELQPAGEFADRLRDRLREAAVETPRSWTFSGRWLVLAAGLVIAAGMTSAILLNRSAVRVEALAQDAIGDHRNCALKYRPARTPVPLEEAAQRFDGAYRLLITNPPDDISTPDGPARVIERHSCQYGAHRFGHVILQYRGRVVSLLVTANAPETAAGESATAIPHVIGGPVNGLSVVAVDGSRHAIMLVSDLERTELTQLAEIVSLPLAEHLARVIPDRTRPTPSLFAQPVQDLAWSSDRGPDLSSLSAVRLPPR